MMRHVGVVIRTDGSRGLVTFNNDTSYLTIKTAVGGYIELVALPSQKSDMWVNEEGKLIGLPKNPTATALWEQEYGSTDIIMGDVLITGGTDKEGNALGLSPERVAYFSEYRVAASNA